MSSNSVCNHIVINNNIFVTRMITDRIDLHSVLLPLLIHFDVISDLLLNGYTASWTLFVKQLHRQTSHFEIIRSRTTGHFNRSFLLLLLLLKVAVFYWSKLLFIWHKW